jgi:hypothetical protein
MPVVKRCPGNTAAPSAPPRTPKVRQAPRVVAGLAAGCALAATSAIVGATTSPAWAGAKATRVADGGTSSGLNKVIEDYTKNSNATFSATYHIVDAKTGVNETITFAQSPGKEAIITAKGSFYITPKAVTACQGSGPVTCENLTSALSGTVDGLKELFSPGVLVETLKSIDGLVATHVSGVNVATSSATYSHVSSTCATLTGKKFPTPVTYCAANSTGMMDHVISNGSTLTLTTYSSRPSASTFAPPAGAKIISIP